MRAATVSAMLAIPMLAQAAPPTALVISNSSYSMAPKLGTCDLSANLVASVLSRAGFKVVRQTNLSNARLGTAIAGVGEEAGAGSRSVIYLCGYAVLYADRLFVLPAEARLERASDVLSQGIVARLLMSSVAGPSSAAGLVLMDVAAVPGSPALEFSSVLRTADAAHGGLVAAALPGGEAPGPGPLAAALSESVGQGPLEVGALLAAMTAQPALRRALLTVRPPTEASWLIEKPDEPAAAPPVLPPISAEPALASATAAPAVATPPIAVPPVAAPPPDAVAELNPAERRRLQLALNRLGYYRGRVDGLFATDTLNAIRQYQRDSNAEATGKLTTRQVDQLLQ